MWGRRTCGQNCLCQNKRQDSEGSADVPENSPLEYLRPDPKWDDSPLDFGRGKGPSLSARKPEAALRYVDLPKQCLDWRFHVLNKEPLALDGSKEDIRVRTERVLSGSGVL